MFVKDVMTPVVVTVSPEDSLMHAATLMGNSGYEALVIVRERKPIGIIAMRDIAVYRLQHQQKALTEVLVSDVIPSIEPVTIGQDEIVEEAAFRLHKHDMDALPVVDGATGRLAGIVSTSDVLRAFIHLLGLRSRSTRITLLVPDRVGMLADICNVVRNAGISIASLATFQPSGQDLLNVVLRVRSTDVSLLVKRLSNAGFRVVHESHVWE